MRVCIDAGHGGGDPGAIGSKPFRLEEKEFNLSWAELLEGDLDDYGDFAVLREALMWAVLVECEFLTNPSQLRFPANPNNHEKLAAAIADGIDAVARELG